MKNTIKICLYIACMCFYSIANAAIHTVTVNEDGSFTPSTIGIYEGDTVKWIFPTGKSGSIAPVNIMRNPQGLINPGGLPVGAILNPPNEPNAQCDDFKEYHPLNSFDFTGPMERAPAGIFSLGKNVCPRRADFGLNGRIDGDFSKEYVCKGTNPDTGLPLDPVFDSQVDEQILENPAIMGVLLRFQWNELLPEWKRNNPNASNQGWDLIDSSYDWRRLDLEIERVVKAGKMYSIAIKAGQEGTPEWLFSGKKRGPLGLKARVPGEVKQGLGLKEVRLADTHITPQELNNRTGQLCSNKLISFGNPTHVKYIKHYNNMLIAVANHIKKKNAWYQALAYVKPSGANLHSHENRLPKNCFATCATCNTKILAKHDYTPQGLYDFYAKQFLTISTNFPNKDMSYMLIANGFPRIASRNNYLGCERFEQNCIPWTPNTSPTVFEQSNEILDIGVRNYGASFAVQHNGLKRVVPPSGFVVGAGDSGQITGFQTVNFNGDVVDKATLDDAMQNAWNESRGVFIEAYEKILLETMGAGKTMIPLDTRGNTPNRTLMTWNNMLKARRNGRIILFNPQQPRNPILTPNLPKFKSNIYEHKFSATNLIQAQLNSGSITLNYVDPARCQNVSRAILRNYGTIIIK